MTARDDNFPEAREFIALSAQHEDACAKDSRERLERLDPGVKHTLDGLGTLLSLLDRLGSCFWGCHRKEHAVEDLVCRAASFTRAALRLVEFGHYDVALALTRTVAETGNLLWLFYIQPDSIREWLDLPEQGRWSKFRPSAVRKAIDDADSVVPNTRTEYAWLSGTGIHPTPNQRSQSHNAHGIPTAGGVYQQRGQVECLTRLAWALATVGGAAAKVAIVERSCAERIVEVAIQLGESLDHISDAGCKSDDEILRQWKAVRSDRDHSDADGPQT